MAPPPDIPEIRTHAIDGRAVAFEGAGLLIVIHGRLCVRDEQDECVALEAGDLLTVTDGGRCTLGGPREAGEVRAFCVGSSWAREALGLAGVVFARAEVAFHVDRCGFEAARRAARLFRELSAPRRVGDERSALVETSRRLELLAIAARPHRAVLDPGNRREGARARRRRVRLLEIVDRLVDDSLEGLSLTALADELGTSERQASRLFRSELGTTFREHLASLRLERAKRLLRETDLPVIEVAAETGWGSLGHFTTTFRRRTGLTPTGYRSRSSDRAA